MCECSSVSAGLKVRCNPGAFTAFCHLEPEGWLSFELYCLCGSSNTQRPNSLAPRPYTHNDTRTHTLNTCDFLSQEPLAVRLTQESSVSPQGKDRWLGCYSSVHVWALVAVSKGTGRGERGPSVSDAGQMSEHEGAPESAVSEVRLGTPSGGFSEVCVCVLSSAAACRRFRQICSLFRWMFQWNSMLRPELHQIPPLICYFLPVRLRWAMGSVRWVDLPAELWLIGAKMNVSAEQRVLDELYWAKGKFSVLIVLLLLIRNFWIFLYDIGNCYR